MTSTFRKWMSALLALLMMASPISASLADDVAAEDAAAAEQTEVASVPEPQPQEKPAPEPEPVIEEATEPEAPAEEAPDAAPEEEAPGEAEEAHGEDSAGDSAPAQQSAQPGGVLELDVSGLDNPIRAAYGTPEGELPLPARLPARFANGEGGKVEVIWTCVGNSLGEGGYLPECEQRDAAFYFEPTVVGTEVDPSMSAPVVSVVYEALPGEAEVDGGALHFAGSEIRIQRGARVSTDDILDAQGYDAGYCIVNEGVLTAGASGRAIPNPVRNGDGISGTILGGSFEGDVECVRGAIEGGSFSGAIFGSDIVIRGGEFRGDLEGNARISGGSFYCNVNCAELAVDGSAAFYNGSGKHGPRKTLQLRAGGSIRDGVFYADVVSEGSVSGGSFYGKFTNEGAEASVLGGTFYGEFDNDGGRIADPEGTGCEGAVFMNDCALQNSGVIDGGSLVYFDEHMVITNGEGGVIESGVYHCKVINYGTIAGGSFEGDTVNMGKIYGGDFLHEMYNEGGTIAGATLNCMLMSNTGMVTLDGLLPDAQDNTLTIASGERYTTDELLAALPGDPASCRIVNEGEITGGEAVLPCDFSEDSVGAISGGSFSGTVYAGAISGGSFEGEVHAKTITGGSFGSEGLVLANRIDDGSFAGTVRGGTTIYGGNFSGLVTSAGVKGLIVIRGGTFTGEVATQSGDGTNIYGGTFNCNVGREGDGYVLVYCEEGEPADNSKVTFTGKVAGRNVVVAQGTFTETSELIVSTVGVLEGGVFYGPVTCNNAITGGEFYGDVTMGSAPNGQIHGGRFHGKVYNTQKAFIGAKGAYKGIRPDEPWFDGDEIINDGVIDPGDEGVFAENVHITNTKTGRILSGNFRGPVTNYGTIANARLSGPVMNFNSIAPSAEVEGLVVDPDGKTITVSRSASIEEIRAVEGFDASYTIINDGTISGPGELANRIQNAGTLDGGDYSGTIVGSGRIDGGNFTGLISSQGSGYAVAIYGGTFSGGVATDGTSAVIYDGTFNCDVGRAGDGGVYVYERVNKTGAFVPGSPVFNGRVAARNMVISRGTFNGEFILSTAGVLDGGVFYGPVTCNNAITGGEFHGTVTMANAPNGQIHSGTFYGKVLNKDGCYINRGDGNYPLPQFLEGEIVNDGIMDPGPEMIFSDQVKITNTKTGRILSGNFRGPVINYGTVSGASLYGAVENHSKIVNSTLKGTVSGEGTVSMEGVVLDGNTITIETGASLTTDQLAGLMTGAQGSYTIVNNGTISGGSEKLDCTVKGGTIRGGNFGGTVCAFWIYGGNFDGPVYAKGIQDGTFNASVRDYNANSSAGIGAVPGMDVTGGLSIQGGTFNGTLGGDGLNDAIFVHGGNFTNCRGLNAWNLTVDAKLTGSVTFGGPVSFTVGDIAGGTFLDTVTSHSKITGGVFKGKVVNYNVIAAGTFSGGIENHKQVGALESYNYSVAERKDENGGWIVETRTARLDGTFLNCEVTNVDGGWIDTGVTWGAGFKPQGSGAAYVAAFVGNTDGSYRVYNAHEFRYGENVNASLARLDEAQSTKSKWTYLDGGAIGAGAIISLDPMDNLFLRESSFNIRNGVLELDGGWSAEGSEPNANYSSVHIPKGATVSAGEWTKPVVNEGDITGGSFVNVTNKPGATIRGATINGRLTADGGTIEGCSFGPRASIYGMVPTAVININFTADGETHSARLGSKLIDALNAIRVPASGYEWYNTATQLAVGDSELLTLQGGSFAVRLLPAPAIVWPTDAAMGINCKLSTATFTDRDPNGSFRWANPDAIATSAGRQSFEMIFTPDSGNRYNYDAVQTRKAVEVLVSERVITIAVDSCTKLFGEADPTFTGTTTGLRDGESINRTFYRPDEGNNAGTYEITARVNYAPAGCTVQVIPGTLTIEPRPLNAAVIAIVEGSRKYYPAESYVKGYTGAAIQPAIQVSFLGKTLVEGRDYTCSYRSNLEPGTAYIDIAGIGNYSGQAYRTFTIGAGKATLHIESCSKEYGDPDPEFRATVTGVADPSLVGYELYRMPGESQGTYSILARKLSGPFDLDIGGGGILTITPKQLPPSLTAPEAQTYTGSPIAAKPAVMDGSKKLTEGVDYTLSYDNNVNAGQATAIATGKGNYAGTQSVSFTIEPAAAQIRVNSTQKNLGDPDPEFSATVTGAARGDRLNYSFQREPGDDIGGYAIEVVPGDNPNYEIETVPGTLTILPTPTGIEIEPDALTLDEGQSGALHFRLIPENTTSEVSFRSLNPEIASVTRDGSVRGVSAGRATIEAATANGKTATCEVIVRPTPKPLTVGQGESVTLLPASRSASAYRFTVDDASIASVDASGKLTAMAPGSTTVTASADDLDLAKWSLTVTKAPSEVKLSQTKAELGAGQKLQINALIDGNVTSDVTWNSSKDGVATVSASGMVTAVAAGTAKITATSSNGKSASCEVSVKKAPTSLELSVRKLTLGTGESREFTASLNKGCDFEISYASTNASIATVSGNRIVAGDTAGTATITASTYNGVSDSCTVTVKPSPRSISLGADFELNLRQSKTLVPIMDVGSYATLRYESSDAKTVDVNADGKLTARQVGKAVITVTTGNGLSASVQVTVLGEPTKVKLESKGVTLGAGQTYALKATVEGGLVEQLDWRSNKSGVASVDNSGVVTAKKAGVATITAKAYNGKKATIKVTVKKAPTSVKLSEAKLTLGVNETAKLKATQTKGSYGTVAFISDNPDVARVSDSGEVLALAAGTATITASTYNGKTAACLVQVFNAPSSFSLGEDLTMKLKKKSVTLKPIFNDGEYSTLKFSTSNKKVATVNAAGKVTFKKAGTVTITAVASNGTKAECTLKITK